METEIDSSSLPLKGITVIDVTLWQQGPIATMMLADLGAEVIRVERPVTGDFSRGALSFAGKSLVLPNGQSILFKQFNRNKKSITLDLDNEKGREVLHRLVKQADAFVTNLTLGALRRFGSDPDSIRKINPKIVYARSNICGLKGPDSELPGVDTTGLARSGFLMNTPGPGGEPLYLTMAISDTLSATMMAFGVVTSLLARERTGANPGVETSQLQTMMWAQYLNFTQVCNLGSDFEPWDRKAAVNPLVNFYRCQDGRWISLGQLVAEKIWPDFLRVMGLEHCAEDARFKTLEARKDNCRELIKILDEQFGSKPRDEWVSRLREIDMCFNVVNTTADVVHDEQTAANDLIVELDDGLKVVSFPFSLENVRLPRHASPDLGRDTGEVLTELGGYTWDEVAALAAEEII